MPPAGCASPSSTMTSAPPASSRRIRAGWVATSITSASGTSGAGRRPMASLTLARVSASWLYTTTFMELDATDPGVRRAPPTRCRDQGVGPAAPTRCRDKGVGHAAPTPCRNNRRVATATTEVTPRTPASRPSLVSVGTIVWLSSELMFFAALFAMYFTIRSVDKGLGKPWPPVHLNIPLATTNTLVLLASSVTCQMGVFAIERGQVRRSGSILMPMRWGLREWYVLTFLMGLYFDLGQGYEYIFDLIRKEHLTLSSSNYGSVFYLTTGFHGLHV